MVLSLKNFIVGESGRITGFDKSAKAYRKRLLAMGLTPGTEFCVTRFAPLGDPIEIKLRGFSLTLRKDEASVLLVEKL
ncbi:MAG: FeoA family protein [Methylomicrobium sp.]